MASYRYAARPSHGEAIAFEDGIVRVPDNPVIPFVEGDGTDPYSWRASVRVFDVATGKVFGDEKNVSCAAWTAPAGAMRVTYDLARQMPGATEVSTSSFGDEIIKGMGA